MNAMRRGGSDSFCGSEVAAGAVRRARHGEAAGILLYDPASFGPHLDLGYTFVGIGADVSFVNDGVKAALAAARGG